MCSVMTREDGFIRSCSRCAGSCFPAVVLGNSNCCLFFLQLGDVLPGGAYVHDLAVFEMRRYKPDLTLQR